MRNKLLLQKGYLLPIFYTLVLLLSVFSVNAQTISTQPTGFSECVGGVQVLRVVATTATTGTTLVYQWQRSTDSLTWTNITGATATSYTPPSTAAGSVFYRVVVRGATSTANNVTSAAAKVVVVADPRITTQPRGYSQAVGSAPIALTVAATGGTPSLVYQWQSSPNGTTWTNVAGATAATYTPLATVTTTMYYRVIVSAAGSGCGSVTSASATVIKTANVSISTQPVGFSACIGSTQALAVAASAGTSSVIYQWQSSRDSITWTNVSGATTASYRPVSTAAGVTFYRVAVRVLNSNSINSNAVKVNIVADPAITTQPTGYNVTMGATATALRVVATGGTPSLVYQWQSATAAAGPWANITGATAATHTPSVAAVGTTYYRVTVSAAGNGCGTATSSIAAVVVNTALGITTQPTGFVQCIGGTQALRVATNAPTGTTVVYQWQSSRDSINWANITGATTVSYMPPSTTAGTNYYRVIVRASTSTATAVTSGMAKVVIVADPAITTQPVGFVQVAGGTPRTLSVVATGGTPSLAYQWQSSATAAGTFVNISGATAATYTPSNTLTTAMYYRVVVSATGSGCGSVTSNTVAVTPSVGDIRITTQPVGFSECLGGTAALRVVASGTNATSVLNYQWQKSSDSLTWTNISGATTANYTPTSTAVGTTRYRVVISIAGSTVSVTSASALVSVVADPAITTQPIGYSLVAGDTTRPLTVVATGGTPSLVYQWQSSTTAAGSFVSIAGATSATYRPSVATTTMMYRVLVTADGSGCGVVSSNSTIVSVSTPITITVQLGNITECIGGTQALNAVTSVGTGTVLVYQWQKAVDSLTWANIAGATSSTYIPSSAVAGTTRYRVVVSAANSTTSQVISNESRVVILPSTTITTQPIGYTYTTGTTPRALSVVVANASANTSYQWQVATTAAGGFTNIAGATTATYMPIDFSTTKYYRVVVAGCGIVTSNVAAILVQPQTTLAITTQPTSFEICVGAAAREIGVATNATAADSIVYQWQSSTDSINWRNVANLGASYMPVTTTAGVTYYRVIVSRAGSSVSVTSVVAKVTVVANPVITTQPVGYTYTAATTSRTLRVSVNNNPANTTNFAWKVATTRTGTYTSIPNATSATYTPTDFSNTKYYFVQVSNRCGSVNSDTVAVVVEAQPTTTITITRQPASANICLNRNTLLSVSATASSANTILVYQWQKSADSTTWVNIAGATSASYDVSATTAGVSYYRVVVSAAGSTATVTSAIARISVTANNLIVVREPQSYSVPAGTSTFAPLTIVVTSSDSTSRISYQWESASAAAGPYTPISGASSASYTPVGLSATTSYRVIVSSFNSQGCGTSINLSATITITPPTTLAITAQPIGFSECVGGNGVLRVLTNAAATTATVAYQWQKSSDNTTWSNIAGATASSYLPPSSVIGTTYYRVIASLSSSAATSVTSAAATVKVEPALSITTQPVGYTLSGTPTPLTIVATGGTPTLMYQWQSSTTDVGPYVDIVGANAASYTPSVNITTTTYYRVLLSASGSGCGSAVSNVAVIRLSNTNTTLAITAQPVGFAECIGGTQTLNIAAAGGTSATSLVYQWQRTTDSVTWTNISGATLASYTPPSTTAGVTFYRASVRVTGGTSILISAPARVSIIADPAIRTQPIGFTQAIGGTRTLSVVATGGTPSLAYQWQVSSMSGGTFSNIPNATTATYAPPSTVAGTAFYRVVVSASGNGCGSATSSIVEVTTTLVNADFIVITQPTGFAQCVGGAQALMVVVNGTTAGTTSTTIRYQWQKSVDSLTWTNITTGTNQYYIPDASTAGVTFYRVVITNTAGVSLTSNPAKVSIIADPIITAQPLGFSECVGGIQALRVAASGGTPTLNYQWQKSADSINWVNITAAIEPSYTPTSTAFGTTHYRVIVSANGNGCSFTTSQPATVVVNNCNITSGFAGQNAGLAIDARVEDNAVKINWYSNTSDKNDYYEVQKLKNTGDFETIDVVNETHNDQLSHTYNFTDKFPTEGENVYRVKLTYQDGNSIASVNQTVVFNKTNADIAVYPNPADAEFWLNIKDTDNTNVTISVLDRLGRVIEVKNLDKNHDTKVYFDTQNWQDGQYFILVQPEGKTQITKRVLIQK